jgi:hypothetical protein
VVGVRDAATCHNLVRSSSAACEGAARSTFFQWDGRLGEDGACTGWRRAKYEYVGEGWCSTSFGARVAVYHGPWTSSPIVEGWQASACEQRCNADVECEGYVVAVSSASSPLVAQCQIYPASQAVLGSYTDPPPAAAGQSYHCLRKPGLQRQVGGHQNHCFGLGKWLHEEGWLPGQKLWL